MLNRDYREVPAEAVADGITIRWVVGRPDGAPNFAMRVIEFAPGARFDTHQHAHEHEIFVLQGKGLAESGGKESVMEPGAAIFIPPNELHGYRNTGEEPLRFICVIPHLDE